MMDFVTRVEYDTYIYNRSTICYRIGYNYMQRYNIIIDESIGWSIYKSDMIT